MNGARRKEITAIINTLESLPERIRKVRDDEREYNHNMPENLELSDRKGYRIATNPHTTKRPCQSD